MDCLLYTSTLLLFAKRVLTAVAIGSVIAIISNSFITVEGTNGKSRYFISPFAQKMCIRDRGRGPLAGPVVAGAVILPRDCGILYLNDSKQLTARKREELYEVIMREAVATGIGYASVSYTHLDVYKRQGYRRNLSGRQGRLQQQSQKGDYVRYAPVSYTHLMEAGKAMWPMPSAGCWASSG